MGDIIEFPEGTVGDVPIDSVLEGAKLLQMVCIMGYTEEGNEYFASIMLLGELFADRL